MYIGLVYDKKLNTSYTKYKQLYKMRKWTKEIISNKRQISSFATNSNYKHHLYIYSKRSFDKKSTKSFNENASAKTCSCGGSTNIEKEGG